MSYSPPPGQSPYPSAPPPSGASGRPTRLRGRTPLRLALIFGVLGIALVVVGSIIIATKSLNKVDGFARVPVATGGTVQLKSGNQLVYYEASDVSSGIDTVPVPAIRITAPDGTKTILDTLYGGASRESGRIKNRLTYDNNGHKGVAIYQLKITQAGTYQVEVQPSGQEKAGADLAFGESIAGGTALGAGLLVPGVLLIIAAIVLLIVGLVKRGRHKKEIASGAYGGGYPGQYGGGQPGQYGTQPGQYGPQPGQYGGQPPNFPPPGPQPPNQGWAPPPQR
ncbi:MAG TPA: hypothetical protein VGN18_07060 [Jatrophihabitans sp.]|uniref:hypothetical protein n=1 Tax=Jatrophihabitans sp. TaxID=1932789 RepID=UPI002DFB83BC|nr:hypothetical protein [Jatrophihabitans sp.]